MNTRTLKALSPFFILLCFLAYDLSAGIENSFPNGAVTLNSTQTITGAKEFTATPTINTYEAATRLYVDETAESLEELLQQGSLRLYYVTATDSTTGGRLLATYPQAVATSIAYPALSATAYTQVNVPARISSAGIPGVATLTAGTINAVRYMSSDQTLATARSVTGVNELWLVDADGSSNPTFVASSSSYVVLGTEIQRISTSYELLADVPTGGTTRRFLEKHYRKRTGTVTGANPIITVYYGGLYESLFTVQLPSAIVMKVDASNAEATAARMNLDVPSNEEARVYTDTLATASALALSNHAASNSTHGCTVIASEAAIAAHAALSTAHNATTLASEAYVTGYAAKLAGDATQDFAAKTLTANGFVGASYASQSIVLSAAGNGVDAFRTRSFYDNLNGSYNSMYQLNNGDTTTSSFWGIDNVIDDGGFAYAESACSQGRTPSSVNYSISSKRAAGTVVPIMTINSRTGNASFSGDVRANSFTLGGNVITGNNWISGDGGNEGIQVNAAGEVLIATTTDAGDYKLQVAGNAYVNGTISGADTWHNASGTFENSWVDNSAGEPAQYKKMVAGNVTLRGLVKSGTVGATIFTLPVGYRPARNYNFPAVSNNAFGYCSINTDGNVLMVAGSNTWFSLDGISFNLD